jgi:hypothetical protein
LKELESSSPSGKQTRDSIEKKAILEFPIRLVDTRYLSIKTKAGKMLRLNLNSTQIRLTNKIKELRAAGKRVRIWLLKYRQGGVSTDFGATSDDLHIS